MGTASGDAGLTLNYRLSIRHSLASATKITSANEVQNRGAAQQEQEKANLCQPLKTVANIHEVEQNRPNQDDPR